MKQFFLQRKWSTAAVLISLFYVVLYLVLPVPVKPPAISGIRLEFLFFALILAGVASFHKEAFHISLTGMLVILGFKLVFDPGFHVVSHLFGETPFLEQLAHKDLREGEWGILVNLLGLLLGFSILAKVFELSNIPEKIPIYLPRNWTGPFVLLILIFVMSSFLDNIAAALIGGTIALAIFRKVHIGFIAAIVAASNAGGAGSVIGDTTTTMMWIEGVHEFNLLPAYLASGTALLFFGFMGARQQFRLHPVEHTPGEEKIPVLWKNVGVILLILAGAIASNILYDMPALGVWIALGTGALLIHVPWSESRSVLRSTFFLLGLVFSASMMPVEELPPASWFTSLALGVLSAFFDNIPLTKICLEQGHFDWGLLAYSVGFGGSMVWFGSSAGVAITSKFPEARNMIKWLRNAWHVPAAFILGFFMMYLTLGWNPSDNKHHKVENCPVAGCPFHVQGGNEGK